MTSTERRRHYRRYKQTRFKIIVCGLIILFGTLIIGELNEVLMMSNDTLNKLNDVSMEVDELKQSIDTEGENGCTWQIEAQKSIGEFTITHYANDERCCGKTDGVTATGTQATVGRTIAVDPEIIPLGSKVIIDGIEYTAEDTGGAVKGRKIDIFVGSYDEAVTRGKIVREVYMP